MSQKVKLVTSEGEVVEVDVDVASKSVLIKGMIDDSGIEEEIPLPNVKKAVLDKIIQFCTYTR
jgi:S-phase kinase-associated protein 1